MIYDRIRLDIKSYRPSNIMLVIGFTVPENNLCGKCHFTPFTAVCRRIVLQIRCEVLSEGHMRLPLGCFHGQVVPPTGRFRQIYLGKLRDMFLVESGRV